MYKSVLINTKGNSNKYRKLTPKKYSNKNFHNLNNNNKKKKINMKNLCAVRNLIAITWCH